MHTVTSRDATAIAFDRLAPDRRSYDRRGRGEPASDQPYSVEGEAEDSMRS